MVSAATDDGQTRRRNERRSSPESGRAAYDRVVAMKRRGPGLHKTRGQRLVPRREVELWQTTDYRWRELFEAADVMSEGAVRRESEGLFYYGTTSVLLAIASRGGQIPDDEVHDVARMLVADPHARLRAIRVACREAQVRSRGAVGRVRAELIVRPDPRGVRVDVDVEARVYDESRVAHRRATKTRV